MPCGAQEGRVWRAPGERREQRGGLRLLREHVRDPRQNVSKNVGGWQGASDEVSEGIEETVTSNWRKAVPGDQAAKFPSPPTTPTGVGALVSPGRQNFLKESR